MRAEDVAARYQQPGKRSVRKFVVDLAVASGCKTALDFWGGGTSAREFTRAGLSVVSAELDRSLWSELDRDAEANGYVAHHGRASKVEGVFDMVWADFCGMVSDEMERELQALLPHVGKFLTVTLMPARERDRFLVRARVATIPAWLVMTTSLSLLYVRRYHRNDSGHEMWIVVLGTSDSKGRAVDPVSLKRHLTFPTRRYWASRALTRRYPHLFPYRSAIHSDRPVPSGQCRHCNAIFLGQRITRRYCDEACQRAAAHLRRMAKRGRTVGVRPCVTCGRQVKPRRSDVMWCSEYCRRDNENEKRRLKYRESQPKPALPKAA